MDLNPHNIPQPGTGSQDKPFPGEVHPTAGGGILVSKLDEVINWARSLIPLLARWYSAPAAALSK